MASSPLPLTHEKFNLEIIEYIQDLGSCWRCAMRFTREREPEAYQRKIVVIINFFTDKIMVSLIEQL
jgi:hypothetical protein